MQRLRKGPLIEAAPGAELWLDGGHNPHAARAIAEHMRGLPGTPDLPVCGMLNTKDVAGFMRPVRRARRAPLGRFHPGPEGHAARAETARRTRAAGHRRDRGRQDVRPSSAIVPHRAQARILICGSLYFAGEVLAENG
jgi:dihydrofolate synthase/folylpolyglutamate synthase